jgi:hypothetical protein
MAIAAIGSITSPAIAGPWLPAPGGHAAARITLSTESADERFHAATGVRESFDPILGGERRQHAVTASFDVAVTERVSAGATASIVSARYADRAGVSTTSGMGDLTMRAQAMLTNGPIASAIELRAKAPTAHEPATAQFLRLSDGQWDVEARASIGRSFWPLPAYAFVEGGYRVRTTSTLFLPAVDVGDEWPYHAEAGATVAARLGVRARVTGYAGRRDRAGFVETPARRLTRFEPSLAWSLPGGAEIEVTASYALSGRGMPAARALRVAYAPAPWSR